MFKNYCNVTQVYNCVCVRGVSSRKAQGAYSPWLIKSGGYMPLFNCPWWNSKLYVFAPDENISASPTNMESAPDKKDPVHVSGLCSVYNVKFNIYIFQNNYKS
jgi:hypothetical protein